MTNTTTTTTLSKLESLKATIEITRSLVILWNWYIEMGVSKGFCSEEEQKGHYKIHFMSDINDFVIGFTDDIPDDIPLGGHFDLNDSYFMIIDGHIQSFNYKTIRHKINSYILSEWLDFMLHDSI